MQDSDDDDFESEDVQPLAQREISEYEEELSAHLKGKGFLFMGDLITRVLKLHNLKGIPRIKAEPGSSNRGGVLVCGSHGLEHRRQIQGRRGARSFSL